MSRSLISSTYFSIILALSGCAQVDRDSASKFASESNKVFDVVNSALVSDKALAIEAASENAACQFINASGEIKLAPGPLWDTDKRTLRRIALLKSMLKYASALYDATDPARFEALLKAANGLMNNLTDIGSQGANVVAPGSGIVASPILKPVAKNISAFIVDVIQIDYQSRIYEVASSMDKSVENAVKLLLSDSGEDFIPSDDSVVELKTSDVFSLDARAKNPLGLRRDGKYLQKSYDKWVQQRICALRAIRSGRGASSDRLYSVYLEANATAQKHLAALKAFKQTDDLAKALVAIRKAHAALITNSSDFNSELGKIRLYAGRLTAFKDLIETP